MNPVPAPQRMGGLGQLTWLPIPLLLAVIAGLWVANPRTVYESQALMVLLNLLFTWLACLCVCILTARGFLRSGQPGLFMFGCGSLLWGATSLAAAMLVDANVNPPVTVHNLGVFGAAGCHLVGMLWHGRVSRPGRWLVLGYTGALLAAGLIVWAVRAGATPLFFVQGQGGTPVRQGILLLAIGQFAWVAWQMIARFRLQVGAFYYWYGLGLALVATGLTGVLLLTVQGGVLGWANRLTQYLGSVYLLIAAGVAARDTGTCTLSLGAVDEALQKLWLTAADLRRHSLLRGLARYGLALAAVAAGWGLRLVLTAWVGPGLPTYITFYPMVVVAALLAGWGPGVLTTAVTGISVSFWLLPPLGQFAIASPVERMGLAIFTGMSLFTSAFAELYRRSHAKAAAYDREAALRENHERLAAFAQASFEGIVESAAGRIVDCNEQLAKMLGYAVAELKGMPIAALIAPEDLERVTANIRHERESMLEHAMLCKDGSRILVEAHGWPVSPGSVLRHTAVRDVSERKQAEAALRESEARFRTLADTMPQLAWTANADGDIFWYNSRWYEDTGTTPEQMEGWGWQSVHDPAVLPKVLERWQNTIATGKPFDMEFPLRGADGVLRPFLTRVMPLRDAQGRVRQWFGTNTDISTLKEAEESYKTLFSTLSEGFCVIDMVFDECGKPVDYRFLEINPAFAAQSGLHQAQGRLMRELAPNHEAFWFEKYGEIALTGQPARFESEARALGRWFEVSAFRSGGPQSRKVAILFTDITQRKQAEQAQSAARNAALNLMQDAVSARDHAVRAEAALRTSEAGERTRREELETLMDALPISVFIAHDAACQRMTCNRAGMELLRLSHGQNPSRSAPADAQPEYDVVSDGRRLAAPELPMQRAASTGQAVVGVESEIVFADGEKRQILGSASPLFDASGVVRGCIGTFVDITSRKRTEEKLSRVNRTLLALSESNRTLLLATTETQMLQEVCRIIVEVCGHAMVWIGFAEDDPAKSVRPVAAAGFEEGYLETLHVTWAHTPQGSGPTGTAIRDGQPSECSDVLTDPQLAPWRAEALKRGYASSLALPLLDDGKAFGAVTVYSRRVNGFSADEVKLLSDLASDLGRGITTLRLREAHQQAEAALRESEARFRSIFHHSATPMAVKLPDGHFLQVNQAYCEMLGYPEAQVLCASAESFTYPDDAYAAEAMLQLVAGNITAIRAEKRYRHQRGHPVWCDTSVSVVSNADGSVAYVIVQAHDITARKEAEENILKLNQKLETRVLERTVELHDTVKELKAEIAERQRLEREILEISEREQCRLGQDLHDGLGQELAGIAILGDVHAKRLQAEAHPLGDDAAKLAAYTRATIDSARRLAKGLYPIELSRYGLLLALQDLAAQTSARSGICCELRQSGEAPALEPSAEIHIYRIVQECISNAVKHASPSHITIEALACDEWCVFAVTDDGVGFDNAAVHAGMGLYLMKYRARVIGAEIVMDRPSEGGCRICCQLPIGKPRRKVRKSPT